ncbi:MAG: LacI family DNA-binding transcriptional regulator [Kiritimatiellales bacterium]
MDKITTMKDIAELAGVSAATVSLALNNNPRISPATKQKILKICRETGYKPNPAARALAQVNTQGGKTYLETLALLIHENTTPFLKSQHRQLWNENLQTSCSLMRYRLESFIVGKTKKEQLALSRILHTRGIRGVIIPAVFHKISDWYIDWSNFSVVSYCADHGDRFSHNVICNSYQDMYDAVIGLHDRGYQCPAYVETDETLYFLKAGFDSAVQLWQKKGLCFKSLKYTTGTTLEQFEKKFMQWFYKEKPDVLISNNANKVPEILKKHGLRIPQDIGFFCSDILPSQLHISGLLQQRDAVCRILVDTLHGMLMRHEYGQQNRPLTIQVPTIWNEGTTLLTSKNAAPA